MKTDNSKKKFCKILECSSCSNIYKVTAILENNKPQIKSINAIISFQVEGEPLTTSFEYEKDISRPIECPVCSGKSKEPLTMEDIIKYFSEKN